MNQMAERMAAYKIFRTILGPIYKFWYRPKIIGRENIPKEGSILVVGNHVHIMDQCNIVIATKRCLRYMAKKEYFDNKKVAWFFRSCGCIPVDRSKKDEEATASAIEVLQNHQALGLFPEGTRNALKEERAQEIYDKYEMEEDFKSFYKRVKKNKTSFVNYAEELLEKEIITKEEFLDNLSDLDLLLRDLISFHKITEDDYYEHVLLPFKFGAVSMAQKTNSYLVPYAITGTYGFRKKGLLIRIGKPFLVGDDLAAANEKLFYAIKTLYKENEKNSGK